MFSVLYLVLVSTLTVWTLILFSIENIYPDQVRPDTLTRICNLESLDNLHDGTIFVGTSLRLLTNVITVMMYINIDRYVRSRSRDGRGPVHYGRYQRNVLTMKQCLAHGILHSVLALKVPIISQLSIEKGDMRQFLLGANLTTIILFDVIFPTWILFNLRRSMPEFNQTRNPNVNRTSFYMTQPVMLPRRPELPVSPTPVSQNVAGVIFIVNERSQVPRQGLTRRSFPQEHTRRRQEEMTPVN